MIFVTGGAGFINENFVLDCLAAGGQPVMNLENLSYAGNLQNLASLKSDAKHHFVSSDIAAKG